MVPHGGGSRVSIFDDCRWVILSNFTTVRLYSKRRGQVYAHAFNLADLANPETLRLFRFLLDRRRLLGAPNPATIRGHVSRQSTRGRQ